MRILAGMSVNIKYTVALFSALDVSVRKKNMPLARFSLHFARMCCKCPRQSLYINLFHSLAPKWLSHFPQLSLFRKKMSMCRTLLRIASACVNMHNSCTFSWIAAWSQCLSAQPFGWIHILNRVSQSSFEIVAGTCPCIKFVNAGDLE